MTKILATAACLFAAGFAGAESISNDTLAAMGLNGVTVVSDVEASEVRGMGFMGGGRSRSLAAGGSFAYVGGHDAAAGSANIYLQRGSTATGGQNESYAGKTVRTTKVHKVGGLFTKKSIKTKSINVFAGGSSSGYAF